LVKGRRVGGDKTNPRFLSGSVRCCCDDVVESV
jgi:hypothetical protein